MLHPIHRHLDRIEPGFLLEKEGSPIDHVMMAAYEKDYAMPSLRIREDFDDPDWGPDPDTDDMVAEIKATGKCTIHTGITFVKLKGRGKKAVSVTFTMEPGKAYPTTARKAYSLVKRYPRLLTVAEEDVQFNQGDPEILEGKPIKDTGPKPRKRSK